MSEPDYEAAAEAHSRAVIREERERIEAECEADPEFWRAVTDQLRSLWKAALEREGNLASAVADVIWKATPYGTTEDSDTFAYIVPKGCMHRLVGVAQQNGAHVPVAFRAFGASLSSINRPETSK